MLNTWVVYEIKNVDNEMRLLGTKPLKQVENSLAFSFHLLREGKYGVAALQHDFKEYGEAVFQTKIVKHYESEQKALLGLRLMKQHQLDNGWKLYNDKPVGMIPKKPQNLPAMGAIAVASTPQPKVGRKLTEEQVLCIRQKYKEGSNSYAMLAQEYGVTKANIRAIIERRTWTHL